MLEPASLFDDLDVTSLVPEVYACFRPMVADCLRFFLNHLSPSRLEEMLIEQSGLPVDATLFNRMVHFMHRCPALHKLGQVIARHRALDSGFRRELQRLESMEPRTTVDEIRPVLERELGPDLRVYDIQPGEPALAEASVAVVLPITWRPPGGSVRRAVLKVLKPFAARHLQEDLDILGLLADHLDRGAGAGWSSLAYREVFDEVRELLTHEIDLGQEQSHMRMAARQLAGDRDVLVPEVLPFSTPRVTAMQRIDGPKVTDLPGGSGAGQRERATVIVRALVGDVLFSTGQDMLFHADPHAGNLLASNDGRLGIIDWSLAGVLTRRQRQMLMQIVVGGLTLDERRVCRSVEQLVQADASPESIARVAAESVEEVRRGHVPAVSWLMRLLDRMARGGVRFPPDLLLFRKTYFTVEGVVGDVCPACSAPGLLAAMAGARLAGEWPCRALAAPYDRNFATHLSNDDLLDIAALAPFTVAHWALRLESRWLAPAARARVASPGAALPLRV